MAATSAKVVSKAFTQIEIEEQYRKALYDGNIDEVERIFPQSKIGVANRFGKAFTDPYPLRIVISGLANAIFEQRERPNTDVLELLIASIDNYLAVINFLLKKKADPKLIFIVPVDLSDENQCVSKGEDPDGGFSLVEKQLSPLSKGNIYDDLIKIHNGIANREDPRANELVGKVFKLMIRNNENFSEKYGLQFIPRAKQELKTLTEAALAHQKNAEELKQKAEACDKRVADLLKQAEEARREALGYRTELASELVQITSYQKETNAFQALLTLVETTNLNKKGDTEESLNANVSASLNTQNPGAIVTAFNNPAAIDPSLTIKAASAIPKASCTALMGSAQAPANGGVNNPSAISAKK